MSTVRMTVDWDGQSIGRHHDVPPTVIDLPRPLDWDVAVDALWTAVRPRILSSSLEVYIEAHEVTGEHRVVAIVGMVRVVAIGQITLGDTP